jgi:hypothetical protein
VLGPPGSHPDSCSIAAELGAGEVAEHDRRVEGAMHAGRFERLGQRGSPGVAAAAARGRDEHDRALGLARGEHPRELEQGGGPRQLGG